MIVHKVLRSLRLAFGVVCTGVAIASIPYNNKKKGELIGAWRIARRETIGKHSVDLALAQMLAQPLIGTIASQQGSLIMPAFQKSTDNVIHRIHPFHSYGLNTLPAKRHSKEGNCSNRNINLRARYACKR